jgi:hypothetical protein
MRVMPGTTLTAKDIISRVEDDARTGFGGRAGHIGGADGVDGEGECRVQFAVVNAVERGGVDHPIGPVLPQDTRDANAVRDVDVGVSETDRLFA